MTTNHHNNAAFAVVETKPNAEGLAERSLLRLGYTPLVIRYNKLLRGVRYEGRRRVRQHGKDTLVERPFIPGYIFLPLEHGDDAMLVDTDHGWGKPQGIRRLLRSRIGEDGRARPKLIRASIVEQIKLAAVEKDETPRPVREDLQRALEKGQARIRHPLGLTATLTSMDEHGRARYVAQLFGGEVSGTVEDTSVLELMAT